MIWLPLLFLFSVWLGWYTHRVWRTRFIIHDKQGRPYLVRFFLMGGTRSENNWLSRKLGNRKVYLHQIIRSDTDRALHDHPWPFTSFMLSGSYIEVADVNQKGVDMSGWDNFGFHEFVEVKKEFKAPTILHRPAAWRHRLILRPNKTTWTLVFLGPKERRWGFWTAWNKWCHWKNYDSGTGVCASPEEVRNEA